jgi:hypothetical protein
MASFSLQTCLWVRVKARLTARGVIAMAGRSASRFRILVDSLDHIPNESIFELETGEVNCGVLALSWTSQDPFFPALQVALSVRRFGAFAGLKVCAKYQYEDGPAGQLFHESVGTRLANRSFRQLGAVIRQMLAHPAAILNQGRELPAEPWQNQ